MAKKNKDNKRGLGRGLDSLIPKIDDGEEEKPNKSSLTLEDILSNAEDGENEIKEETTKKTSEKDEDEEKEKEEKTSNEEIKDGISKNEEISTNKDEELAKKTEEIKKETAETEENVDTISEELTEEKIRDNTEENEEIKKEKKEKEKEIVLSDYELASIEEVKEIIEKNPRITLWSAQSSAVFRYLRKTRPEFSISKEASELIDKAVSEKYPEIWELFEDL